MRRVRVLIMVLFLLGMSVPAVASIYDVSVTAAGDRVYHRQWYYGGTDKWWDVGANPNQVSHAYTPGWGDSAETALSFDLSSFSAPFEDIISATFNFNILNIWTEGRNDVANLNGIGTVYCDGGTGWKSFDITDSLKNIMASGGSIADYYFSYTGYSGFTFGSAEGGQPAFLRITTAGTNSAVPVPAAIWLLGSGLLGLLGIRRKIRK